MTQPKDQRKIEQLAKEAIQILDLEAREAGAVGYMARALVLATMPHKRVTQPMFNPVTGDLVRDGKGRPRQMEVMTFERRNGDFRLKMTAVGSHGLPYGPIPRLLMSWIATEAVRTKERTLYLGNSLSDFLRELGYRITGGERGDITRVREQAMRLLQCAISANYSNDERATGKNLLVADDYDLWWSPKDALNQNTLFESRITLSQPFFEELVTRPVPVDMRILRALKGSSMALDIYTWLTYRVSYLQSAIPLPWRSLELQFGSDYKRPVDFRTNFKRHFMQVVAVWPEARRILQVRDDHVLLKPGRTSVKKGRLVR